MAFLHRWLHSTATATPAAVGWADANCIILGTGVVDTQLAALKHGDEGGDASMWRFERVRYFGAPSAEVLAGNPALAVKANATGVAAATAWPPTLTAAAATGDMCTGERSSSSSIASSNVQRACQVWLAAHKCPFTVSAAHTLLAGHFLWHCHH